MRETPSTTPATTPGLTPQLLSGPLHSVTVSDIASQRETSTCSPTQTLADAADILMASGRTAALVLEKGSVRGVLTENDLMVALLDGAPWDCEVGAWLRGGRARLPGFMVPSLTLPAATTLAEAADRMATSLAESHGFACHHMLVHESSVLPEPSGTATFRVRLLSALDVARGMLDAVAAKTAGAPSGTAGDAAEEASQMTVELAMKGDLRLPISGVASCKLTDTLQKSFKVMLECSQNCALVTSAKSKTEKSRTTDEMQEDKDAGSNRQLDDQLQESQTDNACVVDEEFHGMIFGLITAADALRAFSQRQRGDGISVAEWMHAPSHWPMAKRYVSADTSLFAAASIMAECNVHHLLVMATNKKQIVGVISALDIVCALAACYRFDMDTMCL
eukprot:TRINITY_DN21148_c0_g1_i1.p1 TRINITY_DN21148_c0_g1~~TRINITY_DN21148_c0_g1_i1.p1  ORF type:complete len:441 (-),score=94.21 TRINITY_DN21148_c0_g1_i1:224-1399(-)